ncbi:MAG TPA: glycosyltransferase family 2 protein [Candidatus Paceibacterota bacterium]|nr:glycosyltransferase family 2 protein [Candidatus Paceibacterota bacterium]
MSAESLISVVIPVYNEEKRVARAIRSMQNQTYKNLEIIVVDDRSTDATAEVVKRIAQEDPRVQYHLFPDNHEKRTNWRGYDISAGYAARNYGFTLAKGEWLTTQDADDASLLNRIEVQYRLVKKYDATCVTIQWQQLKPEYLEKKLDIDAIIKEKGEDSLIIRPEEIVALANRVRGPLMLEPLHKYLPFPIKWLPYTRKLFYRHMDSYPGSDNAMFFHHRVRDEGVLMRHRNARVWGVPSGRGSGRDFAFRVATHFKNSWSFKFPMYLWDVHKENSDYTGYEKYIV